MNSQVLREARIYEEVAEQVIDREDRPLFHLCTRTGWMNDPNGFSWYQGKYHLFYQYYPYSTRWGLMHWGHAVSTDLLHWTYCPAALAPDQVYDKDGCFSGSAVTLPDGRQLLMYTGVSCDQKAFGERTEIQTQCLAVGDGVNYEKYEGNPVINGDDLPEGASRNDFRDPRIRVREDGTYDAYIGSRPEDGSGQILLYRSTDGFRWHFEKILAANRGRFGKMWECPDFFPLDGKWVLLVSPQDMLPVDYEYHNGNGSLCLIGSCDETQIDFREEANQAIDYGIDFYAAQTVEAPDGRRIMIGWMQNWDTVAPHAARMKWYGQMTLPRELSVRNGRLYQWPIRELEDLRGDKAEHVLDDFTGSISFPDVKGRTIDLQVEIEPAHRDRMYHKFTLRLAKDEQFYTTLSFHPSENILKIDRKFSGSRRAIIHQRRSKINTENGRLDLRIILDRYSIEVFVNGGEYVLTMVIYTDLCADGIEFLADGNIRMHIVKYDITSEF